MYAGLETSGRPCLSSHSHPHWSAGRLCSVPLLNEAATMNRKNPPLSALATALLPVLLRGLLLDYRLRRRQSRYRYQKRGRSHIVQSRLMAEFHARCFPAMFPANPDLQLRPRRPPAFDAPQHQLSHSMNIQRLKWIIRKYARLLFIHVIRQKSPSIIARESHAHLRQIICPKRKEFRNLRDLVSQNSRPRNFNHRPHGIFKFYSRFPNDLSRNTMRRIRQYLKLLTVHNQGMHNLREYFNSRFLAFHRSFNYRLNLHFQNLRIRNAQSATAMSKHWIRFMQLLDPTRDNVNVHADFARQLFLLLPVVRHEFMQRRIQQANRHRIPVHLLKDPAEISPLVWQKLRQRLASRLGRIGDDHFLDRELPIRALFGVFEILEEHVLRANQTDSLCSHFTRFLCVVRRIGVGSHAQSANAIRPAHQRPKRIR